MNGALKLGLLATGSALTAAVGYKVVQRIRDGVAKLHDETATQGVPPPYETLVLQGFGDQQQIDIDRTQWVNGYRIGKYRGLAFGAAEWYGEKCEVRDGVIVLPTIDQMRGAPGCMVPPARRSTAQCAFGGSWCEKADDPSLPTFSTNRDTNGCVPSVGLDGRCCALYVETTSLTKTIRDAFGTAIREQTTDFTIGLRAPDGRVCFNFGADMAVGGFPYKVWGNRAQTQTVFNWRHPTDFNVRIGDFTARTWQNTVTSGKLSGGAHMWLCNKAGEPISGSLYAAGI